MRNILFILIILSLLILSIRSISQSGQIRPIQKLCEKKIKIDANTPKGLLDFDYINDGLKCDGGKYINLKENYQVEVNGRSINTWLTTKISGDISRSNNIWVEYLAIATTYISPTSFRYITHDNNQDYLVLGGEMRGQYNVWFWQLNKKFDDKKKKNEAIKEWRFIDLKDGSTKRFASFLTEGDNFKNTDLTKIITWGERKGFDDCTIRAILGKECLNDTVNNQRKASEIRVAFTDNDKNDEPDCIAKALNSTQTGSIPLIYLIETWKDGARELWAWIEGEPDRAISNANEEIKDVLGDKWESWLRLKNYNAIMVKRDSKSTSTNKTYVKHDRSSPNPYDIYCIKTDLNAGQRLLFQPFWVGEDIKEKTEIGKAYLDLITKENYASNDLVKNIVDYWTEKTIPEEHYILAMDSAILEEFTGRPLKPDEFNLVTVYFKSTQGYCTYGWKKGNPNPELIRCNWCEYLLKSPRYASGMASSSWKILRTKQEAEHSPRWYVAAIWKTAGKINNYYLAVDIIDTSSKPVKDVRIIYPLENLYGTPTNTDSSRNRFLKYYWDKLERLASPNNKVDNCNSWQNTVFKNDFIDNVLKSIINGTYYDTIRQILPTNCPELSSNMPLDKLDANALSIMPGCFKNLGENPSWRYLLQKGAEYDVFNSSNDIVLHSEWFKEAETKSAWVSWLALANPQSVLVSKAKDCNKTGLRICFMLDDGESLFSWVGDNSIPTPPDERTLIESSDMFFLAKELTKTYLEVLWKTGPTIEEGHFYCDHADTVDFKVADYFLKSQSDPKRRAVLYHLDAETENKIECLSNIENVTKMIYFSSVLSESKNNVWPLVKNVYNKYSFRKIFGSQVALFTINNIGTYWGSESKFGISRGQEVGVIAKVDVPGNLRFGFINFNNLKRKVNGEYMIVTVDYTDPKDNKDLYFTSWINDDYRQNYWRANPIGYFDRIR